VEKENRKNKNTIWSPNDIKLGSNLGRYTQLKYNFIAWLYPDFYAGYILFPSPSSSFSSSSFCL
jgi:hypothetical protein